MTKQEQNVKCDETKKKNEKLVKEDFDRVSYDLSKQLGPEYVSTRPGQGGGRVSYIEGWKAIALANQIFGFNGWNSEVRSIQVDYLDDRNGKFSLGLSTIVRITLQNGCFHEDIGYGHIENARTRAMAFEKCKKEAMTDGMKRALRCFGNSLGNCLYDKEYLSKITRVKPAPHVFDENHLMRPVTLVDPRKRQMEEAQSSKKAAKSNSGLPILNAQEKSQQGLKPTKMEQGNTNKTETDEMFEDSFMFSDEVNIESEDFMNQIDDYEMALLLDKNSNSTTDESKRHITSAAETEKIDSITEAREKPVASETAPPANPERDPETAPMAVPEPVPEKVGFVSARAAEAIQTNSPAKPFDVTYQSPRIKFSVDPTKSAPIKKANTHNLSQTSTATRGSNSGTPLAKKTRPLDSPSNSNTTDSPRRVGMPPNRLRSRLQKLE